MSIFSEDEKADKKIDSNFTIEPEGPHIFPIEQLVFGQFNASRTSFELSNIYQQHQQRKRTEKEDNNGTNHPDSGFSPILQKNSTLFLYVLVVSVAFIILVSFNMAAVTDAGSMM
jgi:hypothetical protein